VVMGTTLSGAARAACAALERHRRGTGAAPERYD